MNTYTRLTSSDFATEQEERLLSRYKIASNRRKKIYNATELEKYLKAVIVTDAGLFLKHIENNSRDEFITSIRHEFERATDSYFWGYGQILNKIHRLKKLGFSVAVER